MARDEVYPMRLVVLDGYTLNPGDNPWTEVAKQVDFTVHDRTAPEQIVERAGTAEIVLTNKTPLSAATLAQLPQLRFISVLATGYNIVDTKAAEERGIVVSNVPEYSTDSVAQLVLAKLLHFCHQPAAHDLAIRNGHWQNCGDFCFWIAPLREFGGLKMGIVGFGRIGRRVGELAHALGMEVLAFDVNPQTPPTYRPFGWRSLEEIFAQSDVVTLHCPQTTDNAGFVNRELLSRMKPTALIDQRRAGRPDRRTRPGRRPESGRSGRRRAGCPVLRTSVSRPPALTCQELPADPAHRLGHGRSPAPHDGRYSGECGRLSAGPAPERRHSAATLMPADIGLGQRALSAYRRTAGRTLRYGQRSRVRVPEVGD